MISEETIQSVSLGRWLVPVLALLNRDKGARFSALARQLDISRSALSKTLETLQQNGWLERNPGHGHPLRPEYVLTQAGYPIAQWSERVMVQRRVLGLESGDLPRWSLPIIMQMDCGWTRFSMLQQRLDSITPRALSLTLKQMMSVNLVQRRLEDGFPPHPLYSLTSRGLDLAHIITH